MKPNVTTTLMNINGREFVLADVTRGMGNIGVFRYSTEAYSTMDAFYMENEPIIKIFDPYTVDRFTDKHITQISGSERRSEVIKTRLSAAAENLFQYNQGLARSATPVLEMLNPGLYVVHESEMHPSDGDGNFFWNNYAVKKAVAGTSDRNVVIGDANFTPSFLIPTEAAASFKPKIVHELVDKVKSGRQLGGVAYHVSGMFCALLKGHHEATASLMNDVVFKCLVIEPLTEVIYDTNEEVPGQKRKIVSVSCPYINIPIEELSDKALERFLITRKQTKPATFDEIKPKMNKFLRIISKQAFPVLVYDKVQELPTCAMVEASSGIDSITEEQLAALTAGEVKYTVTDEEGNEESHIIVSPNYHASVVTVANYLQTNNFNRFLTFAIDLLSNKELTTVHKFIAERLSVIMHPKVHDYFDRAASPFKKAEGLIPEIAEKYREAWDEYSAKRKDEKDNYRRQRHKSVQNLKTFTEAKGIVTLEAAVKSIGDSHT